MKSFKQESADLIKEVKELIKTYPKDKKLTENENKIEQQIVTEKNNQKVAEMAKEELEAEHTHLIEYKEFMSSNARNSLITAPTQVGKTCAIFEFMKVASSMNVPVILSCDNKTDQLEQIIDRMKIEFSDSENEIAILKVSTKLEKQIVENYKKNIKIVIVCLDNFSQIEKTQNALILAMQKCNVHLEKIVITHDEGDVITKDSNVDAIETSQSRSHQAWLNFKDYFEKNNIDLKRVFVSATPENVVYKYGVQRIVSLQVPSNYIGYRQIEYKTIESNVNVYKILLKEQNRMIKTKTTGIILYCVERKIVNGHDIIFKATSEKLSCTISTYNGKGIVVRAQFPEEFETILKKFYIYKQRKNQKLFTYKKESEEFEGIENIFEIKNMSISDFYFVCNLSNNTIVITIGCDLMARGISFVSSKIGKKPALAAITMIYRPGQTMHAVGICQTIGRITGTARSDLKRRLYAPQEIVDDYISFNINQRQYLKELQKNNGFVSKDIMDKIELNMKLSRQLDRPKIGLLPKYKRTPSPERQVDREQEISKMKRLISSWKQETNTTAIAKLFRAMIANNFKMESCLVRDYFDTIGPFNALTNSNEVAKYNLIFSKDDKYHYIKDEARE